MEDSYESAAALVCTIRGATAEHLVAFVGSLIGQQYSVSYVCQLAQHALAFGHWCEDGGISFHDLKGRRHRAVSAFSFAASIAMLRDATPGTARIGTVDALLARSRCVSCRSNARYCR